MLQPNFNTCVVNNCQSIRFTETTGVYSASNTGGYGTPNTDAGDVTNVILTVTDPNGVVTTLDMSAYSFPSTNTSYYIDLPASLFGLTKITDGKWVFTYAVTSDVPVIYTKTITEYYYCSLECCIDKLLSNLDLTCSSCAENDMSKYIRASTLLDALKNAARCGDSTSYNSIKTTLDRICATNSCNSCN